VRTRKTFQKQTTEPVPPGSHPSTHPQASILILPLPLSCQGNPHIPVIPSHTISVQSSRPYPPSRHLFLPAGNHVSRARLTAPIRTRELSFKHPPGTFCHPFPHTHTKVLPLERLPHSQDLLRTRLPDISQRIELISACTPLSIRYRRIPPVISGILIPFPTSRPTSCHPRVPNQTPFHLN
jgi:hypothetical protein